MGVRVTNRKVRDMNDCKSTQNVDIAKHARSMSVSRNNVYKTVSRWTRIGNRGPCRTFETNTRISLKTINSSEVREAHSTYISSGKHESSNKQMIPPGINMERPGKRASPG